MATHAFSSAIPLALALTVSLLSSDLPASSSNGFSGELVIVLEDALSDAIVDRAPLSVFVTAENGRWLDGFAHANEYNRSVHNVRVSTSVVESARFTLGLDVTFVHDPTRKGYPNGAAGAGTFNASFDVKPLDTNRPSSPMTALTGRNGVYESPYPHLRTTVAEGRLEGSYQGHFRGKETKGRLVGILLPLHDSTKGIFPMRPEEHPSLLFRMDEVEELKRRLATPAGRVVRELLEARDHEIAFGILYRLTGEKVYAEKANERVAAIVENAMGHSGSGYGGPVGLEHQNTQLAGKLGSVAVTYDLCFGVWDQSLAEKLDDWLKIWTEFALTRQDVWGNQPMTRPGYHGDAFMIFGSGGLGSLATWGRRGVMPPEPIKLPSAFGGRFTRPGAPTYEDNLAAWREKFALWQDLGKADLAIYGRHLEATRRGKLCLLQGMIGEGGMLCGGGADYEMPYFDYLIAYRNTLGRPITGRPDEEWLAVGHIVGTVWTRTNRFFAAGSPPGGSQLIRWLALCPENWRPVVLGHWCRLIGLKPEDVHTPEGVRRLCGTLSRSDVSGLLFVLKYITPELKPSGPDPAVPLAWESVVGGIHYLRSGWDDPDAVLARLDVSPYSSVSGRAAGDIQIFGFGLPWVDRTPQTNGHPQTRKDFREAASVVQISEPRLMSWEAGGLKTGSRYDTRQKCSVVTVNLDGCYKDIGMNTVTNTEKVIKGFLTTERQTKSLRSHARDGGIRATRTFGADYSGASGAPALFAVLDRVGGTDDPKEWFLGIPGMTRGAVVTTTTNSFTIRQGDASLHGTVVLPRESRIEPVNRSAPSLFFRQPRTGTQTYQYSHGAAFVDTSRWPGSATGSVETAQMGLVVSARDKRDGNFLVILTLQKSAPPAVTWKEQNGEIEVTVGDRKVLADGVDLAFAQ